MLCYSYSVHDNGGNTWNLLSHLKMHHPTLHEFVKSRVTTFYEISANQSVHNTTVVSTIYRCIMINCLILIPINKFWYCRALLGAINLIKYSVCWSIVLDVGVSAGKKIKKLSNGVREMSTANNTSAHKTKARTRHKKTFVVKNRRHRLRY